MVDSAEDRIEALCATILKTDSENWDLKNKAVLSLIEIVKAYENQSTAVITEVFTPALFRTLKEPIKQLIADLRSQQVRDVCTLLIYLGKVAGERMKPFLRDAFVHILEGVKVPNKVMSGYVDDCIQNLIRYCTFKTGIPLLVMEIKDSKAKLVREKCLEYLNCILLFWDLTEKDLDPICDGLRAGLEDASPKARETSRAIFQNLCHVNLRRAERLKDSLPRSVQSKLVIDDSREQQHALDVSSSSISLDLIDAPSTAEGPRSRTIQQSTLSHSASSGLSNRLNVSGTLSASATLSASTTMSSIDSSTMPPEPSTPAQAKPASVTVAPTPGHSKATLTASVAPTPAHHHPAPAASTVKVPASAASNRRRSVVKNPFAETIENFSQSLSNTSSSFHSKSSPVKLSPVGSRSTHSMRNSPASSTAHHEYLGSSSRSAESSPRTDARSVRPNLFPDRPPSAPPLLTGSDNSSGPVERVPIALDMRVYAYLSKDNRVAATIRFIGATQFAAGIWVGVELDSPLGKNNGSVQNVFYFTCRPNFGLFLREENVVAFTDVAEINSRSSALARKQSATGTSLFSSGPRLMPFNGTTSQTSPRSPSTNTFKSLSEKTNSAESNQADAPLAIALSSSSGSEMEKKGKSASKLKVKLSQLMNFLNQQLEIVEELEKEEKTNADSVRACELRKQVKALTEQELETVMTFRNKWKDYV